MFENFLKRQSDVFYIQLWPDRIKVAELNSSEIFDDEPVLAYRNDNDHKIIVEIGAASKALTGAEATHIVNPFYQDDSVVGDVDSAVAIINHALHIITKKISGKFFSPLIIFHPMAEAKDGVGIGDAELKKLLSRRCGAKEVLIMKPDEYLDVEGVG